MNTENLRPIQVGIVAAPLMGWGLERLVKSAQPALELTCTWPTLEEALGGLQQSDGCDVVVLDLGTEESLEAIGSVHDATDAALLLLTGSGETWFLDQAILGGARGIVQKADPPALLLKAIDRVAAGEYWIDRAVVGRIFLEIARRQAPAPGGPEREKIERLSARERRTIAALVADASAPGKLLASRLCISEHTLRNHLTSIYQKLGLANRLDLYAYAMRHGLCEAEPARAAAAPLPAHAPAGARPAGQDAPARAHPLAEVRAPAAAAAAGIRCGPRGSTRS